ncbi:MAG: carboxylating nicotinate-nucleotide diphosphorylase [Deltaproteobacteria bacterium]|nr:carboxylating nicotinate-nucleotide diphosphorylase [Deltaproteobacteria bacterium]
MTDRIQTLIDLALQEDIGSGDITTDALFGAEPIQKKGIILAKQDLVVSGLEIARRVFAVVDPTVAWKELCHDGQGVKGETVLAEISGKIQSLLKGERTALNFLQHLSGVATFTRQFVEKVKKYPVQILDTRKTTPGFRALEKHAVRVGGGKNHRLGLYDRFLIKDNHLQGCSLAEAIGRAKAKNPNKVPVEVEIQSITQIEEAIKAGADILLLDNFSPKELEKAVSLVAGRVKTEASGGVTLENVVDYAKSGVDFISIGALTHSAPAVDIAFEIES